MELRQLRYFTVLASELHFGRAAVQLHLSQPALSHAIAQLERELQVQLFVRDKRNVVLSRAGQAFLADASRAVQAADRAADRAKCADDSAIRHLEVGFLDASIHWPLPQLVAGFTRTAANVELRLRQAPTRALIDMVAQRKLDLAVTRSAPSHPSVHFLTLMREPLLLAVTDDSPLARREAVSLVELETESFVLPRSEPTSEYSTTVQTICADAGFKPRVAAHATSLPVMLHLVASGIGLAIGTASMKDWNVERLTFIPFSDVDASTDISIAFRPGDDSDAVADFLTVGADVAAQRAGEASQSGMPSGSGAYEALRADFVR
jgi:DNA-binding transcriptional LysR family regulator